MEKKTHTYVVMKIEFKEPIDNKKVAEVIQEMDYDCKHDLISETLIDDFYSEKDPFRHM